MQQEPVAFDDYLTQVENALSRYDVEVLVYLWYWSTSLYTQEEKKIVRSLITENIPLLANSHHIVYKGDSFREFVEIYDKVMLDRECGDDDPDVCLVYFAKKGHKKGVLRAIESGANDWYNAIHAASSKGSLELVQILWPRFMNDEFDSTEVDNDGFLGALNDFIEASGQSGNVEILYFLLSEAANASLEPEGYYFVSALENAVKGDHLEFVKAIIKHNPSGEKEILNRLLMYAAKHGRKEMYNYALRHGADDWGRALIGAASAGDLQLVRALMDKPLKDHMLDTAVYHAARDNQLEVIEYLLENGAKPARAIVGGLFGAALGGHLKLIDFFLEKGVTESDVEKTLLRPVLWNKATSFDYLLEQLPPIKQRAVINHILANGRKKPRDFTAYLREKLAELNQV